MTQLSAGGPAATHNLIVNGCYSAGAEPELAERQREREGERQREREREEEERRGGGGEGEGEGSTEEDQCKDRDREQHWRAGLCWQEKTREHK